MGRKSLFEYNPVGVDAWDPQSNHPKPGARVVLADDPGRLKGSHRYVADAETGEFRGMVSRASLQRVTKARPVVENNPEVKARVNSVFNDRTQQWLD